MSPRKNAPVSLVREACRLELRSARYTARHAVHKAARKPSHLTAAAAGVAAVGVIAAAGAGAFSSAAPSLAAEGRTMATTSGAHGTELTSKSVREPVDAALAPKHRSAPVSTKASETSAHKPAITHGPGKPAAPAAAKPAAAHKAAAKPAHARPKPKPSGPTTIYDSVNPSSIPSGQAMAVYANGQFQASWSQVSGHKAMWIDVTGSNTGCDVLDVEPGDASPAGGAAWVSAKLTQNPNATAIIYTFRSAWGETQADVNALPSWMHSHVKYWIADPTGSPHILPGAAATQWYWGPSYDITMASPGFMTK